MSGKGVFRHQLICHLQGQCFVQSAFDVDLLQFYPLQFRLGRQLLGFAGNVRLFRIGLQKVYDLEVPQWTLLTIYELDGDDPQAIIDSIVAVSGSESMPLSDALTKEGMVQVVGSQIAAIDPAV